MMGFLNMGFENVCLVLMCGLWFCCGCLNDDLYLLLLLMSVFVVG